MPEELASLIEAIDQAYRQSDVDREILERSLDLSSEELLEANEKLRNSYELALKHVETEKALRRSEQQLRQASKLRIIGQLAGGIAHDFNNILFIILANTELTRTRNKEAEIDQRLEQILIAAKRGADLVERILTFSREQSPESEEKNRQPIRLADVVTDVLGLLKPTLPATITLEHSFIEKDQVFANRLQIHRVILNLCSNAAQAIGSQAGTIWIRTLVAEDDADGKSRLALEVEDTGCGIEPEALERIFEPFFTTKRVGAGTGLGLAMVDGIVSSLGGCIETQSTPGKGTTFRILLPRYDGGYSDSSESADPALAASFVGRTDAPHLLVVDDEESIVEVLGLQFQEYGLRVTRETSPLDALAYIQAEPGRFDLILTDLAMPKMNGLELAQNLHAVRPDLPVVLMTGWDANIVPEELDQGQIKAVLRKPIHQRDLLEVLRPLLEELSEESK